MSCPVVLRLFQEMGNPEVMVLFTEILIKKKRKTFYLQKCVNAHKSRKCGVLFHSFGFFLL